MKYNKIYNIIALFSLTACGAMGFGKNNTINIYNNSDEEISINAYGGMKVQPKSSTIVQGHKNLLISSKNKQCFPLNVEKETNSQAVILDIIPGVILGGIIPIIVDFATDNLTTYPESIIYNCNK